MTRLRWVSTAPADPPHPLPRVAALQEQCQKVSAALDSVSLRAEYQNLVLLAWSERTTDGTLQWAMDDAPRDQFERAFIWWPPRVGRLPHAEQSALSAALLRQILRRLARLRAWSESNLDVVLSPLVDVPEPERRVVYVVRQR